MYAQILKQTASGPIPDPQLFTRSNLVISWSWSDLIYFTNGLILTWSNTGP